MDSSAIRVGLIGAGLFGQRHARVLKAMYGVTITAVADIDEQAGRQLADHLKATYHQRHQDLLADDTIDIIVIATPDAAHFQIAMDALKTPKAIFLEKPMTTNLEEAKNICAAVEARPDRLFMMGHLHRFDPRYYAAHRRIKSGEIGELVHINIRRSLGRFAAEKAPPGSNLIYHTAVHDIDSLRFLTGLEVTKVYAQAVQHTFGATLDAAAIIFTLSNGALCTMDTGWVIPSAAGNTLDAQWSLVGQQGVIYIQTQDQGLMTLDNYGYHFPDVFRYQERDELTSGNLREELEYFIYCIRTGQTPRVTVADGFESIRIAESILESISSGQVVNLPIQKSNF